MRAHFLLVLTVTLCIQFHYTLSQTPRFYQCGDDGDCPRGARCVDDNDNYFNDRNAMGNYGRCRCDTGLYPYTGDIRLTVDPGIFDQQTISCRGIYTHKIGVKTLRFIKLLFLFSLRPKWRIARKLTKAVICLMLQSLADAIKQTQIVFFVFPNWSNFRSWVIFNQIVHKDGKLSEKFQFSFWSKLPLYLILVYDRKELLGSILFAVLSIFEGGGVMSWNFLVEKLLWSLQSTFILYMKNKIMIWTTTKNQKLLSGNHEILCLFLSDLLDLFFY